MEWGYSEAEASREMHFSIVFLCFDYYFNRYSFAKATWFEDYQTWSTSCLQQLHRFTTVFIVCWLIPKERMSESHALAKDVRVTCLQHALCNKACLEEDCTRRHHERSLGFFREWIMTSIGFCRVGLSGRSIRLGKVSCPTNST